MLNKHVNKGCAHFVPTVEFEHVCSVCHKEEYTHKNRIIEKNGYHKLRILNRATKEYSDLDININWQIRDLIRAIERKFNVERPMQVHSLHLQTLPDTMDSPFHVMKGMRLHELDVDFRCNICVVTYSIGNKRHEALVNCVIIGLCLPCACLCLPQYAFDLVSEAVVDGIIYAGTCLCTTCCCRRSAGSEEAALSAAAVVAETSDGGSDIPTSASSGASHASSSYRGVAHASNDNTDGLYEPLIAPSAPEMPAEMLSAVEATPEMVDRC